MPIFKTPGETTVGRIEDRKKLTFALKEALISTDLSNSNFGVEPRGSTKAVFYKGTESTDTVPPFVHPVLIENFRGMNYLVSDIRLFRTSSNHYQSDRQFEEAVRNKSEFALMKTKSALSLIWLGDDPGQLRTQFSFAGGVYAAWLSNTIGRFYGLDLGDQTRISAISLYFYHLLFQNDTLLQDGALETAVVHTIKTTKMPAADIYALFEKMEPMEGIADYCKMVVKLSENIRLKGFDLQTLLTIIRNSWYGTNAKEMLQISLEHPPTWITIVYATLTERGFKSSPLYKTIDMMGKRGNADEFVRNLAQTISLSIVATEEIQNTQDAPLEIKDFEHV